MVKRDLFQRSLDAGISFVGMTRERAESVVKEWVDAGDLGRGKAKKAVDDLIDRSQRASEELRGFVRREIADQLSALGVATSEDLTRLEARIDGIASDQGTSEHRSEAEERSDQGTSEHRSDGGPTRVEGP